MKTKTTETVEVVKITCDHCGVDIGFSRSYCIVCGKYCCDRCYPEKLRCLHFDGPKYFGLADYMPDVPRAYACYGCNNTLTDGIARLKVIVDDWKAAAAKMKAEYYPLAQKCNRQIEKREKEIEW